MDPKVVMDSSGKKEIFYPFRESNRHPSVVLPVA